MNLPYQLIALIPILIFTLVHLCAKKISKLGLISHGQFLSIGGGVSIAYVFMDLLPKIGASELIVKKALHGFLPFLERHVYILALIGFLLFFLVDRGKSLFSKKSTFYASVASYALFNLSVGYAVADRNNPEVQPLALFTVAIALHYFITDHALNKDHGKTYSHGIKWILIVSLFAGWFLGISTALPREAIAMVDAFIGGGMVMSVVRHELPVNNANSIGAFLIATIAYTAVLLMLGAY